MNHIAISTIYNPFYEPAVIEDSPPPYFHSSTANNEQILSVANGHVKE